MADGDAGDGLSSSSARPTREEGERKGKMDTALGEGIRMGTQARRARFADVRRVASPVLLPSARVRRREHSSLDEFIYIDFDQSLTAQNSKFHMGT